MRNRTHYSLAKICQHENMNEYWTSAPLRKCLKTHIEKPAALTLLSCLHWAGSVTIWSESAQKCSKISIKVMTGCQAGRDEQQNPAAKASANKPLKAKLLRSHYWATLLWTERIASLTKQAMKTNYRAPGCKTICKTTQCKHARPYAWKGVQKSVHQNEWFSGFPVN